MNWMTAARELAAFVERLGIRISLDTLKIYGRIVNLKAMARVTIFAIVVCELKLSVDPSRMNHCAA
jgi:hypothetical protein